jgi:hypothetical protein
MGPCCDVGQTQDGLVSIWGGAQDGKDLCAQGGHSLASLGVEGRVLSPGFQQMRIAIKYLCCPGARVVEERLDGLAV